MTVNIKEDASEGNPAHQTDTTTSSAPSGHHQKHQDHHHHPPAHLNKSLSSTIQIDYVIVFSLVPLKNTKQASIKLDQNKDRADQLKSLTEEYELIIQRLRTAGLSATGRPGSKSSNELLILVSAHNEARIKQEIQAERIADWLHGITSVKPESNLAQSFLSQPYTPAERSRHLYNIITRETQPHLVSQSPTTAHPHRPLVGIGAGIIPGQAPFEHVKSIFPPHDLNFNNTWLSQWSDRSHLKINIPEFELDQIKDIYGESIGYYFAFLNFYFQALAIPTGLGFLFWITGMVYSSTYSAILVVWSVVFTELWIIKERLLAIKWNSFNCHQVEKRRVEFIPEKTIRHPVTRERVGYFPWWKRETRKLVTIPVFVLFALGISALITFITAIELVVAEVYTGPFKKALALLPTVLFAASVPVLVGLWQSTAVKLANWENHSYNSSYDRSLTIKVFMVQGLVAYAGLLLTAFIYVPFGAILVPHLAGIAHKFIKQDSIPLDGSPDLYLNTRALDFTTYSINTARLYEQLFAYQVTNQLLDTFTEVGLPYITKIASFQWHKIKDDRQQKQRNHKNLKADESSNQSNSFHLTNDAPEEHELLERLREEAARPEYRLFVEYAEMAIQFGYVVLWTVVWPISPLFSFVNNFFELRTDAIKLTKHSRRPIPTRCDSIGPWVDVMSTISWLGVIINVMLVYLFKSSSHKLAQSLKHKEGSTESTETIVADLFTAAILKSKQLNNPQSDCDGKMSINEGGIYDELSSILLSVLIPVLVSEHGFFLIRFFIRKVIYRLKWKDSQAEVKQKSAEWELKQTFIERLELPSNDPSIANSCFLASDFASPSHASFWHNDQIGVQEINRALKVE